MRPTINSAKHIVQQSIDTTAAGVVEVIEVLTTVGVNEASAANEVRDGAVVKAIYIEMWLRGNDAAVGSSYIYVFEKSSGTEDDLAAGSIAALDDYSNKKNVFFISQGLINAVEGVATPVLRQWIKIPRSKQRMGRGDKLKLSIMSQSGSTLRCGLQIYKEYF